MPDHFGRHFDNAAEWAKDFDDPAREEWQLTNLPEPVDLVLVVDTYHHIPNRVAYSAH